MRCGKAVVKSYDNDLNTLTRWKAYNQSRKKFGEYLNLELKEIHRITPKIWRGNTLTIGGKTIFWEIVNLNDPLKEAAQLMGSVGGANGTGKAKVRGDSDHYNKLRLKGLITRRKNKVDREKNKQFNPNNKLNTLADGKKTTHNMH